MACKIYDSALVPIGRIEHFVSLVWREGASTTGELQLVCYKNSSTIPLIKMRHFVGIDDSDTLMFIQSVQDKDDQLWAYGIEAKALLSGRVYPGTYEFNNALVEPALRAIIDDYADVPCLELGTLKSLGGRATLQRTYPTLDELSRAACDAVGYGYTLRHDISNRKLLYELTAGQTRTGVKFAAKYGNLSQLVYTVSEKDFANFAYVGGRGEGADRVIVSVDQTDGGSGFDKRTIWVEATDIEYAAGTDDLEAYKAKLRARGREKLNERKATNEINFTVAPAGYRRDYWLGDTVTADLPEYSLTAEVKVAEVQLTYEKGIRTIKLTLGTPIFRRRA